MPATFRVLDCTVRDGGFTNGWRFSADFVRDLYQALDEAGVESMEVGFANARERWQASDPQPWQCVTEGLLRATLPERRRTRVAVMADTWGVPRASSPARSGGAPDLVRVACRLDGLDAGLRLVAGFHEAGYETSLNLLAVSEIPPGDLSAALVRAADSPADVVYVVDSYGHLHPRAVRVLVERFREALPGKALGFHGHNNRQLALANTLMAAQCGASLVDASLLGMGRGAGNCPLELLLAFRDPSPRTLVPLLRFVALHQAELPPQSRWGYSLPLMLTGLLNRHPREATEELVREFCESPTVRSQR